MRSFFMKVKLIQIRKHVNKYEKKSRSTKFCTWNYRSFSTT